MALAILLLELVWIGAPHLGDLARSITAQRSNGPPAASVAASPTPSTAAGVDQDTIELGAAPLGEPLFWAQELPQPSWLVAYDSDGRAVGTLKTGTLYPSGPQTAPPSPDGETLYLHGAFVNARGEVLARPVLPDDRAWIWEGGGAGVCGDGPQLWTYRLGSSAPSAGRPLPQGATKVVACNFERDLALVEGFAAKPYVTDLWWVRLGDGSVSRHVTYRAYTVGSVVASRDLRYYAENYYPQPAAGQPVGQTAIRRVDTGALVVTRPDLVYAFSADSTALAAGQFQGGDAGIYTLGGRALVASQGDTLLLPGPTGGEFLAVQVQAAEDKGASAVNCSLVHSDGTETAVLGPLVSNFLSIDP